MLAARVAEHSRSPHELRIKVLLRTDSKLQQGHVPKSTVLPKPGALWLPGPKGQQERQHSTGRAASSGVCTHSGGVMMPSPPQRNDVFN
mmetsp:Transcript_48162/g.127544  ORF Transcript_48162/g.127544 Transcript_48162/m.127544 type:complete len:89 (-) Transcript_48162:186-452(-)